MGILEKRMDRASTQDKSNLNILSTIRPSARSLSVKVKPIHNCFPVSPLIFFVPAPCISGQPIYEYSCYCALPGVASLAERSQEADSTCWKPTFFPGLPSTIPTAFSAAPLTLSVNHGFLCFTAGAFFFSTRPVVVALARGLEILAFGFVEVVFLVVVVFVLVLVFVAAAVGVNGLRGALLPVACRVDTMFAVYDDLG